MSTTNGSNLLAVVDYQLIAAGDNNEVEKLWKAATEVGFWYLVNHGIDGLVEDIQSMGTATMNLSLEEKLRFEQGGNASHGYRAMGAPGSTIELISVAQDDVLAWPHKVHCNYPSTVNSSMESVIAPFIHKSTAVSQTLMKVFDECLGLPSGTIMSRHTPNRVSSSEVQFIKILTRASDTSDGQALSGPHTDFTSLSSRYNWLGGFQVLIPDTSVWQYVQPIPGYAIYNVGDMLSLFSGGILRSSCHRVIPTAESFEYCSVEFFVRPNNDALMA